MEQIIPVLMSVSALQIISFLLIGISLFMIFISSCRKSNGVAGYKLMKVPMIIYIIELTIMALAIGYVYVYLLKTYVDCADYVNRVMENGLIKKADLIAEYFGKDIDSLVAEGALKGKNYFLDSWAVGLIISMLKALDYNITTGWICMILVGVFFVVLTVLNYLYFGKIIKSMNIIISILKNPTAPIRKNVSIFVVIFSFFFGIEINILHGISLGAMSNISINPGLFFLRYLFVICCGLALARYHRKISTLRTY